MNFKNWIYNGILGTKNLKPNIMKRSINFLVLVVVIIGLVAFVSVENQPEEKFNETFAEVLEHAKAYTLEVANEMPEEKYTYRPTDAVRTFGQQMAHIGMSTKFILGVFIKGEELTFDPAETAKMEKQIGASKEECIKTIETAFDEVISTLKEMDDNSLQSKFIFLFSPEKPEFSKEDGFIFIRDHITHHRAQAIVYLRMNGLVPPGYRAF
jgi:uncharacterized damage-inducible protein DinB